MSCHLESVNLELRCRSSSFDFLPLTTPLSTNEKNKFNNIPTCTWKKVMLYTRHPIFIEQLLSADKSGSSRSSTAPIGRLRSPQGKS